MCKTNINAIDGAEADTDIGRGRVHPEHTTLERTVDEPPAAPTAQQEFKQMQTTLKPTGYPDQNELISKVPPNSVLHLPDEGGLTAVTKQAFNVNDDSEETLAVDLSKATNKDLDLPPNSNSEQAKASETAQQPSHGSTPNASTRPSVNDAVPEFQGSLPACDSSSTSETFTLDSVKAKQKCNDGDVNNSAINTSPSKWDDWDEDGDSADENENNNENSAVKNENVIISNNGTADSVDTLGIAASATSVDVVGVDLSNGYGTRNKPGKRGPGLNGNVELSGMPSDESWASTQCLLCTKCDHEVIRFPGSSWSERVDYIFFRNYGGVLEKLSSELLTSLGTSSAYCCQCAWQTVSSKKSISSWGTEAAPEGGSGSDGKIYWIEQRSSL